MAAVAQHMDCKFPAVSDEFGESRLRSTTRLSATTSDMATDALPITTAAIALGTS